MWTTLALIGLAMYILDLQMRIREVSEEVSQLHQDFIIEANIRSGENYNGKK
jgi:hypothetical protein